MMDYKAASYQQDIMNEISKQSIVHFYGPNFIDYDPNDSIDRVLSKAPFDTDLIILGMTRMDLKLILIPKYNSKTPLYQR